MAATLRKTRQDEVRAKIKIGNILTRLEKHAEGKVEMSSTQLKANEILLRKVLPDLSNIELSGTGEDGEIIHRIERVIVDK